MTPSAPERFDADPSRYAEYLGTTLGRLRLELAWLNLEAHLPRPAPSSARALDLGAGTGELPLRLAAAGWTVALVDGSERMLQRAAELARERGLASRISCRTLDLERGGLAVALGRGEYHLVLCHDVLEYLTSPEALLREARATLAPAGRISLLVRNRAGEALKHLLRGGEAEAALAVLAGRRVREDLFGLEVRLFDPEEIRAILAAAGLEVVAERGVRVVADHLASLASGGEDAFQRTLELERRLGESPALRPIARYLQVVAARGAGAG